MYSDLQFPQNSFFLVTGGAGFIGQVFNNLMPFKAQRRIIISRPYNPCRNGVKEKDYTRDLLKRG